MGSRKLLPCNLTNEEKETAWDEFEGGLLTREEMEWVSEVLKPYLFYRTEERGNTRECICTHEECGRFTIRRGDEPAFFRKTHGGETICPKCGQVVNLVALGKMRSFNKLNQDKWERITLCRNGKDGALLLLSGYAKRSFCWGDLRPYPEVSWKRFTYLKPGKRMQWVRTWEPCGQRASGQWWWDYQWNPSEAVCEPFQPGGFYSYASPGHDGDSYFLNYPAIEQSAIRYSQVEDWMYKEAQVFLDTADDPIRNAVKYLSAYTQYPAMEIAVKIDMHHAATELAVDGKKNYRDLNWDARTIPDFLRLNKQDAKVFVRHGGNLPMLKAYHTAKKTGATCNMNEFFSIIKEAGCVEIAPRLAQTCVKAGCTMKAAIHYIQKFEGTGEHTLTMWTDYLDMAAALKYDLTRRDVTMPKNLQERHDVAAETTRYMRVQADRDRHRKYNEKLRKMYEFEYEDLCIVVPNSVEEIIQEGKTLQHCVAGYAARHFNGQLHILFLRHRRKPGVPFVTIEIHTRKTARDAVVIQQIHGYRNEGYLKPIPGVNSNGARPQYKYKWFLDVWRDWVKNGSRRDKDGKPILRKEKEKTA